VFNTGGSSQAGCDLRVERAFAVRERARGDVIGAEVFLVRRRCQICQRQIDAGKKQQKDQRAEDAVDQEGGSNLAHRRETVRLVGTMAFDPPPIFIIDDEEPVRAGLARLLRAIGMPSVTFESAESFLDAYDPQQHGCLLVDIRMPGMSGLDLIEELERRKISLPAIVMTGHADARAMERLRALNTMGCLEKPFRVTELKEILDRWWSTLDGGEAPWREKRGEG
jgi:CheY-like chemotaxis protein